jgi:lipopolysaccharide export LptBFGC system permease protein LptF
VHLPGTRYRFTLGVELGGRTTEFLSFGGRSRVKRVARVFGAICGLAFVVLLVVAIVNIVQGNPAVNYGVIAIVLALLTLGAERLGRS